MFGKKLKGQAAMEYLMMYGWAIFLIGIVMAILLVATSLIGKNEYCIFNPQSFSCGSINPIARAEGNGDVSISLQMSNNVGQAITIKEALCVRGDQYSDKLSNAWTDVSQGGGKTLNPGATINLEDIGCYEESGSRVKMAPGQTFSGKVFVRYRYINDFADVDREAVATIATQVVPK